MKVVRTISIDSEIWNTITQVAEKEGKAISELVEEILVNELLQRGLIKSEE